MLKRKPILTIFYDFNPWEINLGGIEIFIRYFIKYSSQEIEVRFVGGEKDKSQKLGVWRDSELAGRKIIFLPLYYIQNNNPKDKIPDIVKYTAALFRHNLASDFMHFHRLEPSIAALRWQGKKSFFIHTDITKQIYFAGAYNSRFWKRFPSLYRALEGFLINQFTEIFSCNRNSLQNYEQLYPKIAQRLSYLNNLFDGEIFYPLNSENRQKERRILAQQMELKPDTNFMLFVGRLGIEKDPILLIRTIAAMKNPKAHLLIVGDGELKDEISSEVSRLRLSQQVTMLGAIPLEKVAQLQRICNVLVLTSAYEGLPLVALEALASGTPVVTTEAGDTPKLLSENSGIVCQQRSPQTIAAALNQVLRYPENYPIYKCTQAAEPFNARTVVSNVCDKMLSRWKQKNKV